MVSGVRDRGFRTSAWYYNANSARDNEDTTETRSSRRKPEIRSRATMATRQIFRLMRMSQDRDVSWQEHWLVPRRPLLPPCRAVLMLEMARYAPRGQCHADGSTTTEAVGVAPTRSRAPPLRPSPRSSAGPSSHRRIAGSAGVVTRRSEER